MPQGFSWSPQQLQWLFSQMGMPLEQQGGDASSPSSPRLTDPMLQAFANRPSAGPPFEPGSPIYPSPGSFPNPDDITDPYSGQPRLNIPDVFSPSIYPSPAPELPTTYDGVPSPGIQPIAPAQVSPPQFAPFTTDISAPGGVDVPTPLPQDPIMAPEVPPFNPQQYPSAIGPEFIPPPPGFSTELAAPPDLPPEYPTGESPAPTVEQPAVVDTSPYPAPGALPPNPFDQPITVDPSVFQNRYDLVYGPQNPNAPVDTANPPDAGSVVFGQQPLDPQVPAAPDPNQVLPAIPMTDPTVIDPRDPNNNLTRGGISMPLYPTSQDVFPQPGLLDELRQPTDWANVGDMFMDAGRNIVDTLGNIFTTDPFPNIAPSGSPVGSYTPDAVFRSGGVPGGGMAGNLGGGGGNLGTWQNIISRGIWGGRQPFTESNFKNMLSFINYQGNPFGGVGGPAFGGMNYQQYVDMWNRMRAAGSTDPRTLTGVASRDQGPPSEASGAGVRGPGGLTSAR